MKRTGRLLRRFGCLSITLAAAAVPSDGAEKKWAQEAQMAVQAPFKVNATPMQDGPRAGEPLDFSVDLQNGKNQPVWTTYDTPVQIQLYNLSGEVVRTGNCKIAAKEAAGKCTVEALKPGVYKFKATPKSHELTEGTGYVLIRPDAGEKKRSTPNSAAPQSRPKSEATPRKDTDFKPQARMQRLRGESIGGARLWNAAYLPDDDGPEPPQQPAAGCGASVSRGPASIVLAINEGGESGGAFRAGLEYATIQAFFQAEDGGSAPSDILVWLSPDHGDLNHQPLVIPRCSISGEAHLTSKYPVLTSVAYTVVPGAYPVKAPKMLHASFVRPIVGIGVVPTGKQTLSLIDRGPIVVSFFDADGNTIPTDLDRTVKFVSASSFIGAKDPSVSLKPGDFSAETVLLPFWLGAGSIFVTADRLKTATHEVEVVGTSVILVCLSGGLLGALVLYLTSGGKLYSRVIVGLAAGIVLTWAYVFSVLPKVDSIIAHNFISVFVVSILGGYLGIKAFDKVLDALGWGSSTAAGKPKSPTPPASPAGGLKSPPPDQAPPGAVATHRPE